VKKILLLLTIYLGSCTTPKPAGVIFWTGVPEEKAIYLHEKEKYIKCEDDKFRDYMCLSYEDFDKL